MYKTIDEVLNNAHAGDVFQLYNDRNYHYTLTDEWCYAINDNNHIFVNEDDFTGTDIDMITRFWHYDNNLNTFTLVFVKEE